MNGYTLLSQGAARPGMVYGPHYGFSPWMTPPEALPTPRQRRVRAQRAPEMVFLASGMPGSAFVASGIAWAVTARSEDEEAQYVPLILPPTPGSHADPRLSNRIER